MKRVRLVGVAALLALCAMGTWYALREPNARKPDAIEVAGANLVGEAVVVVGELRTSKAGPLISGTINDAVAGTFIVEFPNGHAMQRSWSPDLQGRSARLRGTLLSYRNETGFDENGELVQTIVGYTGSIRPSDPAASIELLPKK